MKKKKLKLSLNKSVVAKLNKQKLFGIKGGAQTTDYPICGISGCWGAQSCFPDTGDTFCNCIG